MEQDQLLLMQQKIWEARLPLEIRIAASECRVYDQVESYLVACPRLSYLPSLLPKLLAFFSPYLIVDPESIAPGTGIFTHENIPLKWHLPIGLLYDIYVLSTQQLRPDGNPDTSVPFKLTLHFTSETPQAAVNIISPAPVVVHDAFINSVKEADFLRSGTAKPIMSLSALDSKALWSATQENDLSTFSRIHNGLLPAQGQLRSIPFRLYLPLSNNDDPGKAQVKVLQSHLSPHVKGQASVVASHMRGPPGNQPQTLGVALHTMVPSLFPSRRTPILARPLLHGALVPMAAPLEDLARKCCYADGWVNVVISVAS